MSTLLETSTGEKLLPLFADLSESRVKLTALSDQLKVEGEYSDEIVRRLKEAKQDILAMLKSKTLLDQRGPWELSTARVPSQVTEGSVDLWMVASNGDGYVFWYLGNV